MTIAPLSKRAALRTSELDELKIGKRGAITRPLALITGYAPLGIQHQIIRSASGFRHVRLWQKTDIAAGTHHVSRSGPQPERNCSTWETRWVLL
jgi:hypothetical protein